jgi:hypothetical protein
VSRTEIALPNNALLVVGWDRPLATFYGQAFKPGTTSNCQDDGCFIREPHVRRECQDGLITIWVGTSFGELPNVEDLERELGGIAASLTEDTKAELRQAKAASTEQAPSPIVQSLLAAGVIAPAPSAGANESGTSTAQSARKTAVMISTEGLNRFRVLAALCNNARVARSLRALDPRSYEPMSSQDVFDLLHGTPGLRFGILKGRVVNVDLSNASEFDATEYDRANGQGHAAMVINHLRETGSIDKIEPSR